MDVNMTVRNVLLHEVVVLLFSDIPLQVYEREN